MKASHLIFGVLLAAALLWLWFKVETPAAASTTTAATSYWTPSDPQSAAAVAAVTSAPTAGQRGSGGGEAIPLRPSLPNPGSDSTASTDTAASDVPGSPDWVAAELAGFMASGDPHIQQFLTLDAYVLPSE